LITIIVFTYLFKYFHHSNKICSIRLSGSALISINEVTLRRARLVLGWVTVHGQANHLGL